MNKISSFLNNFKSWAINQKDIVAAVLVGSHARNAAKEGSDIDLVIVTKTPEIYLNGNSWVSQFGRAKEHGIKDEDWGLVKTKRIFYKNGLEIEFNITTEEWTRTDPLDEGTKKVMRDGYKVLVDKNKLIENLVGKI